MRTAWRSLSISVIVLGLTVGLISPAEARPRAERGFAWQLKATGSDSHFRGLSAVNRRIAWLGGYDGTVLRTTDGGDTWVNASPAGAGTLQFRDMQAFDSRHAVAMAAGTGTDSRLYATDNGGQSWTLAYENTDPAAFFDCMSFSDRRHGLVLSDPVDGKFRILATSDGGHTWTIRSPVGMPAALDGEFGFAASGECLTTRGRDAWFGAGGAAVARLFHSRDFGRTWTVADTPLVSGPSAGIFGVAFRNHRQGVITGGDFSAPTAHDAVAARSDDRGASWTLAMTQPGGYRSGVTWLPRLSRGLIAVGPTGSDVSLDGGRTWTAFDSGSFDTVDCTRDGACWASGEAGRVAVLTR